MKKPYFPRIKLDGKNALVTGAARGLGKWISLGLASAGANVALADINRKGAIKTVRAIEEMGRKAIAVEVDVTEIDSIQRMVDKTLETFGCIDCLINNAGVNVHKPISEITTEDFDYVCGVNFRGIYFTSQIVAGEMISRGGGKIVNIASAAGFLLRPGVPNSVYAGTKAAIIMLTKSFAEEFASHEIYVIAIAPGYFRTPLVYDRLSDSATLDNILAFTPLKKIGEATDIIGPVIFLVSEASNFITGQTIFVDGGRSIL